MTRLLGWLAFACLTVGAAVSVQQYNRQQAYLGLLTDGEDALAAGQSSRAVEAFSGALALRPGSMPAYYRRGEAYRQAGRNDDAVRDLETAAKLSPDAPQPLVALAEIYDARNEPAIAAEWYRQAGLRLKDADPRVLYAWGLALYRSGQPAAARDPLRRALAQQDGMAEAQYLYGLASRDVQELGDAVAALDRAVRLNPRLLAARDELADIYRSTGQFDREVAQRQALIDLDPSVDRQVELALALLRAKRYDDASRVLSASGAASDDSRLALASARVLIARAEELGQRAAAVKAAQLIGSPAPGSSASEGLALYGRALALSGDLRRAERVLGQAVASIPVDIEAYAFLADAAVRLGHPVIARDALRDLDALQGDTVNAELRAARARDIGALSLTADDPATALAFLSHAAAIGTPDPATLGLLARARWLTGDFDGARQALATALALNAADRQLKSLEGAFKTRVDQSGPAAHHPPE